jgi:hypothetical protein
MYALGVIIVVITGYTNTSPANDEAAAILHKPFSNRYLQQQTPTGDLARDEVNLS